MFSIDNMPLPPPPSSPPPPYPHPREHLSLNWSYLQSLLGIWRISQLVAGAICWIILAAHKYEGPTYFAVFAAVLVWLLTLAIFGLSLLSRWALVPGLGSRWLITNIVYDLLFGVILFSAAAGIIAHKGQEYSYCNVKAYTSPCNYRAYMSAAIFAVIAAIFYLLSGIYCLVRRSRGHHDIMSDARR